MAVGRLYPGFPGGIVRLRGLVFSRAARAAQSQDVIPSTDGAVLDGIQYLRALGALMVVAIHARFYFGEAVWVSLGTGGATLMSFFVISAFVIAYTTDQICQVGFSRLSGSFLRKRLLRILPLYWLALFLECAGHWVSWINTSHSIRALYWNWNQYLSACVMDAFFIPHPSVEYSGHVWPIIVPAWTLNYEMPFYFLFAAALLGGRFKYLIALGGLGLAAAIGAWQGDSGWFGKLYGGSVFMEFALGLGLFLMYKHGKRFGPRGLHAVGILVFGTVAVYIGAWMHARFWVAIGAALLIWGSAFLPRSAHLFLKVLKYIGDASYCIYLFHTVIAFHLAHLILDRFTNVKTQVAQGHHAQLTIAATILFTVLLSTVVGILLHETLEKPLARRLFRAPARVPRPAPCAGDLSPTQRRALKSGSL